MCRDAIRGTRPTFSFLDIGNSIMIINLLKGVLPLPDVDDTFFFLCSSLPYHHTVGLNVLGGLFPLKWLYDYHTQVRD